MLNFAYVFVIFLSFSFASEVKVLTQDGRVSVVKENTLFRFMSKVLYWEKPKPMKLYDSILRGYSVGVHITSPTTLNIPVQQGQVIDLFDINANATISGQCINLGNTPEGARRLSCSAGNLTINLSSSRGRLILSSYTHTLNLQPNFYHIGTGISLSNRTGRGVYVAIVDSGIDLCHPLFKGRIAFFYDAVADKEMDKNAISEAISNGQCDQDFGGHGTAVAGLVASIAPEAELIIVRVADSNQMIMDTTVIKAIDYLKNKRRATGRPMVINLSLGNNYGPGDGKSLLNLAIEQALSSGTLVVAAGGNEGDEPIRGVIENAVSAEVQVALSGGIPIEVWHGGSSNYRIELCDTSGRCAVSTAEAYTSTLPCVSQIERRIYPPNGKYMADIYHNCNGLYNLRIQLVSGQPSRVDLFAGLTPNAFRNYTVSDGRGGYLYTIANPADGRGVIAVGSFTSRPLTPDSRAFTDLGLLAYFSSRGPTVDGRIKPDITTGGYYVYTAIEGSGYGYIAGTSFSSSVIAGILSLLLEANPNLDTYGAKDLLCRMAIRDLAVGEVPNNFFGCGKAYISNTGITQQPPNTETPSQPSSQRNGGSGGCHTGGSGYLWIYTLMLVIVLLRRLKSIVGGWKEQIYS